MPNEGNWDPRFIERWAKIYVERYLENKDKAVEWGVQFFPTALVPMIAEAAHKELRKRGIRLK
jgi:hypothetical protein